MRLEKLLSAISDTFDFERVGALVKAPCQGVCLSAMAQTDAEL
jgi:hypothetical protein